MSYYGDRQKDRYIRKEMLKDFFGINLFYDLFKPQIDEWIYKRNLKKYHKHIKKNYIPILKKLDNYNIHGILNTSDSKNLINIEWPLDVENFYTDSELNAEIFSKNLQKYLDNQLKENQTNKVLKMVKKNKRLSEILLNYFTQKEKELEKSTT